MRVRNFSAQTGKEIKEVKLGKAQSERMIKILRGLLQNDRRT